MSLVSSQVSIFEAHRGGKIYFLVVCDAVLVFILAEGENAREIMSFPQLMFSLEPKAVLLTVLLFVCPGGGWAGTRQFLLPCHPGSGSSGLRRPVLASAPNCSDLGLPLGLGRGNQ